MVEAHGSSRGRSYMLSAAVYRAKGEEVAYTRQAGFSSLQHEQMVLGYVGHHGRIQRKDAMELCRLNKDQAFRLLVRLTAEGRLIQKGEKRGTYYVLPADE